MPHRQFLRRRGLLRHQLVRLVPVVQRRTSSGNCAFTPLGNPDSRCIANPPCGNTGACNGAGACQLAATTVSCGTQSCSVSTFIPISHCNGTGSCPAPSAQSCSPYTCGTNACQTSCTVDGDCVSPFTCQGTAPKSCALKPNGQACAAANQCISGNCVNGVCCGTATCGTCQTCAGTSPGTCTPLAAGTPAPAGQCTASPPCGNTGTCNGASGCTQAGTNVTCAPNLSCSGMTYQPQSFCNGSGMCNPATATNCGNYLCASSSACRTDCTADSHCANTTLYCTGDASTAGTCVAKKANGDPCGGANQCTSGACINGVCCGTASCGSCQTCNGTTPGTCTPLAAGTTAPAGQCPANLPCGNTGTCNGASGCTQAGTNVACAPNLSCTGMTYQPQSFCNGSGTCNPATATNCGNYVCGSSTACRTDCSADSHCANTTLYCTGNASTAGSCVAKKANGDPCGGANQCTSGACIDGACCGSASCGTCQTCNGTMPGTCTPLAAGTPAPGGQCAANLPCGNTGTCNGASGCTQAGTNVTCAPNLFCTGMTYQPQSFCNGSGTCNPATVTNCGNYVCASSTACRTDCTAESHCANSTLYCTGNASTPGTCVAKNANGTPCGGADECTSGACVDGVCCASGGCPTCQACNVNGQGTCAVLGGSTPEAEPHGRCPDGGQCGNDGSGLCVSGACRQVPVGSMCGAGFSCLSPTVFQPAGGCNSSGTCSTMGPQDCSPFVCATGGCLGPVCGNDTHCAAGNYCNSAGSCVAKQGLGASCAGNNECAGGNFCTDGVCCGSNDCGACNTCNGATPGTCSAFSNGTADSRCPTQGAASCGTNGLCEGGACQLYGLGTQCNSTCENLDLTRWYCDGMHACNQPQVETCASVCDPSGCQ